MKNLKLSITALFVLTFGLNSYGKKDKSPTVIEQEIIIETGIDKAWQVLGPQFADAYKWASSIKHSEAKNSESLNGSTCTERGCDVAGMGDIKEKLLTYSETEHSLSYEVYDGMPSMVKYASNLWTLTDLGNGKTKLNMHIEMKTGGFMGWMMHGMMKSKMKKLSKEITEEFKYYTENGTPHPRTLKKMKKS